MDKSKSGRVRKKPQRFVDFESPDEIDDIVPVNPRQQIRKAKKKSQKKVSYFRK